jgi:hypothetical protein
MGDLNKPQPQAGSLLLRGRGVDRLVQRFDQPVPSNEIRVEGTGSLLLRAFLDESDHIMTCDFAIERMR